MIEKICKFSILRYVPDEVRQEFINIGLVFHSPLDNYLDVKITSNFSRVSAFDDELDTNFLKIVLSGVKRDFSQKIDVGAPSFYDLGKKDFLNSATAFYSNQLQFSPIYSISSNDIVKDFNDLFRTYVYFDTIKTTRITSDKVKSIMNRVLKEKPLKLERDVKVNIGPEEIVLDYLYESRDTLKLVKALSFDYTPRGSNTASQVAKEWAWNYSKMMKSDNTCNQFKTNKKNLEIVTFIYVGKKTKNIKLALDILKLESNELIQAENPEGIELFANKITQEITGAVLQ